MTNRATAIRAWLVTAFLPGFLIVLLVSLSTLYFYNGNGIDEAVRQTFRFLFIFVLLGVPYSIVHELGHAITGWWYGTPPRRIRIGSKCLFRIGRAWGMSVWFSFFPFGGRVDFRVYPLERGRRISMYAAGVGAALLVAISSALMIPAEYQWLRIETVLSFGVFCLIDLFAQAPEGHWSDGKAIRGLLRYSRRRASN